MEDEKKISNYATYFDTLVSDKNMQMLKTLIPFMPPHGQKILSIMVKITELKNTISLLNSPKFGLNGIHNNEYENNFSGMLEAMKQFIDPKDAEMLDMFMAVMELSNMPGMDQNDILNNYMEMFSGMQ